MALPGKDSLCGIAPVLESGGTLFIFVDKGLRLSQLHAKRIAQSTKFRTASISQTRKYAGQVRPGNYDIRSQVGHWKMVHWGALVVLWIRPWIAGRRPDALGAGIYLR